MTDAPSADQVRAEFAQQLGHPDRIWPSVDSYAEHRKGDGSLFDPADPLLRRLRTRPPRRSSA